MPRRRPEDLSVQEIRFLLVEKRRAWRNMRLQQFQQTQRVIPFANEWNIVETLDDKFVPEIRSRYISGSRRTWLDYVLVGVESLAIIGIIAVVISNLAALDTLNRNVSAALLQPTLAPTPMVQAVVLPDGHTPPNSPGGARPNEAEIPCHLRPV